MFNTAGGTRGPLLDPLDILATDRGVTVAPSHTDPRPGDVRNAHADIGAARRDLGYEPGVSFRDGLARTLAWFGERAQRT